MTDYRTPQGRSLLETLSRGAENNAQLIAWIAKVEKELKDARGANWEVYRRILPAIRGLEKGEVEEIRLSPEMHAKVLLWREHQKRIGSPTVGHATDCAICSLVGLHTFGQGMCVRCGGGSCEEIQ